MAKTFRGIKNVFLLITGFLTCPCHLPFVLPALAGLFAGTAIGAFIAEKTELLIALATIYFIGVVLYFLRGKKSAGAGRSAEGSGALSSIDKKKERLSA